MSVRCAAVHTSWLMLPTSRRWLMQSGESLCKRIAGQQGIHLHYGCWLSCQGNDNAQTNGILGSGHNGQVATQYLTHLFTWGQARIWNFIWLLAHAEAATSQIWGQVSPQYIPMTLSQVWRHCRSRGHNLSCMSSADSARSDGECKYNHQLWLNTTSEGVHEQCHKQNSGKCLAWWTHMIWP